MSLQCDNLSGELQDQWSSSYHDLVSNLDRAVSRGHRQTDVIVMDFAKAFDKVPHKRLLYQLDF